MKASTQTDLGRELVRFFEEFLPGQRGLSPNTVRSHRDAMLLLLQFASADAKRPIEVHLYEKGGHGFGMSGRFAGPALWIDSFHAWMKDRKIIPK